MSRAIHQRLIVEHDDPHWRDHATCAHHGEPEWWTGDNPDHHRQAATICQTECPVQAACLTFTLAAENQPGQTRHGIAAGLTPNQRGALANQTAQDKQVA